MPGRLPCARGRARRRTAGASTAAMHIDGDGHRRGRGAGPERHRPAGAVGRRALGERVGVEACAPAAADGLRAGRAGRGHDRARAVGGHCRDRRVDLRDLARRRRRRPRRPRACVLRCTAPFGDLRASSRRCSRSSTTSPRWRFNCTAPTAPCPMTCPAQPVPPSATNSATQAITLAGVNNRLTRLMLPPSLVVAYRIWGDRHSPLPTLVACTARNRARIEGGLPRYHRAAWSSAASPTCRRTSSRSSTS